LNKMDIIRLLWMWKGVIGQNEDGLAECVESGSPTKCSSVSS
jgi:hypothetical protein